jgi:CRISPR-associated protein Cas5d
MGYGFKIEVWGDYALFSRPELKVERVSYDVITPSSARAILEAVLWKPAIKYVIDKIYVLNPIKYVNIRRNEVNDKLSARNVKTVMASSEKGERLFLHTGSAIAQRSSLILKDVRYVIEAHFEMTENAGPEDSPEKFYAMICRRLRNGQCFHTPYFGCREFPVNFRLYEEEEIKTAHKGTKDLGLMLYDMDYTGEGGPMPCFFRAIMENGEISLKDCEVFR